MAETAKADVANAVGAAGAAAEIVAIACEPWCGQRVCLWLFGQHRSRPAQRRGAHRRLESGRGLLDLGGLHLNLVELLGREVDVVTPSLAC